MTYKIYQRTLPDGSVYIGMTERSVKGRAANGENYRNQPGFDNFFKEHSWDEVETEVLATTESKKIAQSLEHKFIVEALESGKNVLNVYKRKPMRTVYSYQIAETGEIFKSYQALGERFNCSKQNCCEAVKKGRKLKGYTIIIIKEEI